MKTRERMPWLEISNRWPVVAGQGRGSRFTSHVPRARRGFTLIELLVVIAIIAALAALTFPAVSAAKVAVLRSRAKAEMIVIQSGIELYKDKFGYFPPDNYIAGAPGVEHYARNQLYYELMGTTNAAGIYHTLDDSGAPLPAGSLATLFGPNVTGFMNCVRGGTDEAPSGQQFLKTIKQGQRLQTTAFGASPCTILGAGLDGPLTFAGPNGTKINPWRYNSSNPRFNPKSFDLWIDVTAGSKTNRICNWSDKPLVVTDPL